MKSKFQRLPFYYHIVLEIGENGENGRSEAQSVPDLWHFQIQYVLFTVYQAYTESITTL